MTNLVKSLILATCGLLYGTPPAFAAADPGHLLGHWSFDAGSLADASGNNNHGKIAGQPGRAAGVAQDALKLDGSSYVEVAHTPGLKVAGALTIEAWFNLAVLPQGHVATLIDKGTFYRDTAYHIFVDADGNLISQIYHERAGQKSISELKYARLELNKWYYVVCTSAPGVGGLCGAEKLYVNGVQVAANPIDGAITTNDEPLQIGNGYMRNYYFAGLIDEVSLHDRALSATEIAGNFHRVSANLKPGEVAANIAPAPAVGYDFAYYPYERKVRARLDLGLLGPQQADVKSAHFTLRRIDSTQPLASADFSAFKITDPVRFTALKTRRRVGDAVFAVPALPDGTYEVAVQLLGGPGVPRDPIMGPAFVRYNMAWEHNRLGVSDTIVQPFTPIRVEGRKVGTVLRTHTLNDLGLLDQVVSLDRLLLKSPMRLEFRSGGRVMVATGAKFRFNETTPTHVATQADWTAGTVSGTTRSSWDYDGMMKWTLDIQPSPATVEAMTLVIPLDNALTPLFHACTDGLRFNYAGATPAGEGCVWDGSKAPRNAILGSYVPYIWLGAEERGLAVFGDNDKGWVAVPQTPCQELVRRGDTLELRLNLIAAPTKIAQARRIVIGFQATPAKPMPPGWRTWAVNLQSIPASQRNAMLLGNCMQWGGEMGYEDLYPPREDFRIYDKLAEARRTGEIDQKFLADALANIDRRLGQYERENIPDNLSYGYRACASKPQNILVYTNPRGLRFDTREGQTFLDEWLVFPFMAKRTTGYAGNYTYDADPCASYRDYAVWYYKKMLDTFADGIYWDNSYLKARFDTVGSEAYEVSPEITQPCAGLYNLRALIRRTAVFVTEMKKRPFNMAHMTNTAIVPVLSFCQTQLSLENAQGDADFQDRFSRDYLRAETIGRQSGNVPFALVLVSGKDEKKNAWAYRTAAGVFLTHEIHSIMNDDPYRGCFRSLLDFGYGKTGTRVYNYWQPGQPVRVEGADVATLTVSKPGSTMLVICDYGNGGDVRIVPDLTQLGLRADFVARDAETKEVIPVANRQVVFPLKKHDFRMIVLE